MVAQICYRAVQRAGRLIVVLYFSLLALSVSAYSGTDTPDGSRLNSHERMNYFFVTPDDEKIFTVKNSTSWINPERAYNWPGAYYRFFHGDLYLGLAGSLLVLPGISDWTKLLDWFISNAVRIWFFQQVPAFARLAHSNEQQLLRKMINDCRTFPVQIQNPGLAAKLVVTAVCPESLQPHWLFKASPVNADPVGRISVSSVPDGVLELERLWQLMIGFNLEHLSLHPVTEGDRLWLAIRACQSSVCETLWLDINTDTTETPQWLLRQIMKDDRAGALTVSALDDRLLYQVNEAIMCRYRHVIPDTGTHLSLGCQQQAELFSDDISAGQRRWIYTPHLLQRQHNLRPWLFQGRGLRIFPLSFSRGSDRYRSTSLYLRWMEDALSNMGVDDKYNPVIILSSDPPGQGLIDYQKKYYAQDIKILGFFYNDVNMLDLILGSYLYVMSMQVNALVGILVSPQSAPGNAVMESPRYHQATGKTALVIQYLQIREGQQGMVPAHELSSGQDRNYQAQFDRSGKGGSNSWSVERQGKRARHHSDRRSNGDGGGGRRPPRQNIPWRQEASVPPQLSFESLKSLLVNQDFPVGRLAPLESVAQLAHIFPSRFIAPGSTNDVICVREFHDYIAQIPWASGINIHDGLLHRVIRQFEHRESYQLGIISELLQRDITVFTVLAPAHHTYQRYYRDTRTMVSDLVHFRPEGYQGAEIYLFAMERKYCLMEPAAVPETIPPQPELQGLPDARDHPQVIGQKIGGRIRVSPVKNGYHTLQESYFAQNRLFHEPQEFNGILLRQFHNQPSEFDNGLYQSLLLQHAARAGVISMPVSELAGRTGMEATKTFMHLLSGSWERLEFSLVREMGSGITELGIQNLRDKVEAHVYDYTRGHMKLQDIPPWFWKIPLPGTMGFLQIRQHLTTMVADILFEQTDDEGQFKAAVYGSQAARALIVQHGFDGNYSKAIQAGLPAANDIDIMVADNDTAQKVLESLRQKIRLFPSWPRLDMFENPPFISAGGKVVTYRVKVSVDQQRVLIVDVSFSTERDYFDWRSVQVTVLPGLGKFLSMDGIQSNMPQSVPAHKGIQIPVLGLKPFIKAILVDTQQDLLQQDAERRIINAHKYLWLLRHQPLTIAAMMELWGPGWHRRLIDVLQNPELLQEAIHRVRQEHEIAHQATARSSQGGTSGQRSIPDNMEVDQLTGEVHRRPDESVFPVVLQESISGSENNLERVSTPEPAEQKMALESSEEKEQSSTEDDQEITVSIESGDKPGTETEIQLQQDHEPEPDPLAEEIRRELDQLAVITKVTDPGPSSPLASESGQLPNYFPDFQTIELILRHHPEQRHWYFNNLAPELQGSYWLWQGLETAGVRKAGATWWLDSAALQDKEVRESLRRAQLCGEPVASFIWHYQYQQHWQPSLYKAALVYEPARLMVMDAKLNVKAAAFDPKGVVRLSKLAAGHSPLEQPVRFSVAAVNEYRTIVVNRALTLLYREQNSELAAGLLKTILYDPGDKPDPAVFGVMVAAGLGNQLPEDWQVACTDSIDPVFLWVCRMGGAQVADLKLAQLAGHFPAWDAEQLAFRKELPKTQALQAMLYSGDFLFNPAAIKKLPLKKCPVLQRQQLFISDLVAEAPTGEWLTHEKRLTDEVRIGISRQGNNLLQGKRPRQVMGLLAQIQAKPEFAPLVRFWQGQQFNSRTAKTLLLDPQQAGFATASLKLSESEQLSSQWPELALQGKSIAAEKLLLQALVHSGAIWQAHKSSIDITLDIEQLSQPTIHQMLRQAAELNNSEACYLLAIIAHKQQDPLAQVYLKRAALQYLPARNLLAVWAYDADSPYFDPGALARVYATGPQPDKPVRTYQVLPFTPPASRLPVFAWQWFESASPKQKTSAAKELKWRRRNKPYKPGELPEAEIIALLSSGAVDFLTEQERKPILMSLTLDNPFVSFVRVLGMRAIGHGTDEAQWEVLEGLITGKKNKRDRLVINDQIKPLALAARIRYATISQGGLSVLSADLDSGSLSESLLLRIIYTDELLFNKSALIFLAELLSVNHLPMTLIIYRELLRQFPEMTVEWLDHKHGWDIAPGTKTGHFQIKIEQLLQSSSLNDADRSRLQGYLQTSSKSAQPASDGTEKSSGDKAINLEKKEVPSPEPEVKIKSDPNWEQEVVILREFLQNVSVYSPDWFREQHRLFSAFDRWLEQRVTSGETLNDLIADGALIDGLTENEHPLGFLLHYFAEQDTFKSSLAMRRLQLMLAARGLDIGARILAYQVLASPDTSFNSLRALRTMVRPGPWRISINDKVDMLFAEQVLDPRSDALVKLVLSAYAAPLKSLTQAAANNAGLVLEQRRLAVFRIIEILDPGSDFNQLKHMTDENQDKYQQALLVTVQHLEQSREDELLRQFIVNEFGRVTSSAKVLKGEQARQEYWQKLTEIKQDFPDLQKDEFSSYLPWVPDIYRHPDQLTQYARALLKRHARDAYILAKETVFWFSPRYETQALIDHVQNYLLPIMLMDTKRNSDSLRMLYDRLIGLILYVNHPVPQPDSPQVFKQLMEQVSESLSGEEREIMRKKVYLAAQKARDQAGFAKTGLLVQHHSILLTLFQLLESKR